MSFARIMALFDFLFVSQIEVVSLNRKGWSLLLSTENYLRVLWDSRYKNWVQKSLGEDPPVLAGALYVRSRL